MSFTERCNRVRKSIPFAYWLVYDCVVAPFLVVGAIRLSYAFIVPLAMLAVAVFFDINEAIVKWVQR